MTSAPEPSASRGYVRALRGHPLIASAIFVLILGAAVAIAVKRSPTYQATARILVTPLPPDDTTYIGLPLIRDSGDATRTMETVATLVDSSQAAQATATTIGRGWTEQGVQQAVNVQPEGQSNILDVTASASRPELATTLANTFANSSMAIHARQLKAEVGAAIAADQAQLATIRDPSSAAGANLIDALGNLRQIANGHDPTISLSQSALAPKAPSGLSRPLIILIGLIVAAALASGVVLGIELLRPRRINEEEELLAVMPAPVLARVPVLHAGLLRRLDNRAPPPGIAEALRGIRMRLDLLEGRHRTILVTSASHADGKTTTVIGLARELAQSGGRVVILDLDLRKPQVGARLNVEPAAPLPQLLESPNIDSYARVSAVAPNIRVIAARPDPESVTLDRVASALYGALERLLSEADYILLDVPPIGEVADVLRFIGSVDDVLMVSRLGRTKVGSLEVSQELLDLADRPPTGHVIIGSSPRHAPAYGYYYATSATAGADGSEVERRPPVPPYPR